MAMVYSWSQFFGELSAGVAARSLIAAVCALLEVPIAKNFMANFFQERGRELVAHEGECMKGQVSSLIVECCLRLFVVSTD